MKNKVYLLIIITALAAFSCTQLNNPFLETALIVHNENIDSQRPETSGKEFYLAFTEQLADFSNPVNLSVFISGINAASGNVYIYGLDLNIPFTVAKDEIKEISIPYETAVVSNDTIENYGIFIQTDSPVTVTGLNQELYTTDSFLAFPVQSLGTEYYALAYKSAIVNIDIYTSYTAYGSNFVIVSTQDDTSVNITPTITSGSRTAGVTYNIKLNKYQTYRLTDTELNIGDVTGSHILSDKPVAVFSGHKMMLIPSNIMAGDHLYEQMIPVKYWSNSYFALPFATRSRYNLCILASQDNTAININGSITSTINAGEFFERIMTETAIITADKPVLAAQFAHGSADDAVVTGNGDPFMVILPAESQFLNNYLFTTMEPLITNNHINIIIFKKDKNNLRLDDLPVDPALFFDINGDYSGATISVSQGSHSIKSLKKFGLMIYGFDLYESYGHVGG